MKKFLLRAALCAALLAPFGLPRAWAASLDSSVVKVFATVRYPAPFSPWTKQAPRDISGSGVVIEGDRILAPSPQRQDLVVIAAAFFPNRLVEG